MTTIGQARIGAPSAREVRTDRPATSLRFDTAVALLVLWMIGGAFLDGWAHNHLGETLETFFTPWHAALYSGFLAVMTLTLGAWALNIRKGYDWRKAMPRGYELSLIGVAMFAIGGMGDMFWHTIFGIELNVEAAYSPTHQLLLTSLVILALGPLRSAFRQDDATSSFRRFFPAVLSIAMGMGIILFLFQGINLFVMTYPSAAILPQTFDESQTYQNVGIASGILQTGMLMGIVFLLIRRWGSKLPFGVFTFIFSFIGLVLATQRDTYALVLAMLAAGLTADLIVARLQPSEERRREIRVLAFIVPIVLFGSYFIVLAATSSIWWSIHTVSGVLFATTGASLLLSYLVFLPTTQPE